MPDSTSSIDLAEVLDNTHPDEVQYSCELHADRIIRNMWVKTTSFIKDNNQPYVPISGPPRKVDVYRNRIRLPRATDNNEVVDPRSIRLTPTEESVLESKCSEELDEIVYHQLMGEYPGRELRPVQRKAQDMMDVADAIPVKVPNYGILFIQRHEARMDMWGTCTGMTTFRPDYQKWNGGNPEAWVFGTSDDVFGHIFGIERAEVINPTTVDVTWFSVFNWERVWNVKL